MRVLAIDAALGRCSAALVADGVILGKAMLEGAHGQAGALAPMVRGVMAGGFDAVAVCVGPGSFTGLRASIALAQGLAAGADVPLVGVSVAAALGVGYAGRALWVAIDSRRGRVFLDRGGALAAFALAALPAPEGPVALAGDAAPVVAAWLAARGHDVLLTARRRPRAEDVAAVARAMLEAGEQLGPALPLYVDPPEARLPAGGLRPAPVA